MKLMFRRLLVRLGLRPRDFAFTPEQVAWIKAQNEIFRDMHWERRNSNTTKTSVPIQSWRRTNRQD